MQVLTRSDGVPGDSFGETTNGVESFAELISGIVEIRGRGGASVTTVSAFTTIDQNDVFSFIITDDGLNLTFTMNEIGGQGASVSISTTSSSDLADDFIVFHNREQRLAG